MPTASSARSSLRSARWPKVRARSATNCSGRASPKPRPRPRRRRRAEPAGVRRTAAARGGLRVPRIEADVDDLRARSALDGAQLAHLGGDLDTEADGGQRLSIGEQQRLAFARVLLKPPRPVFLDEASSAMDEGLEHAMYTLLPRELPQCIVVSVGHRRTLHAFHTHRLQLQGGARWSFEAKAAG